MTQKVDDFLPLSQTTFYICSSLADGPKHGYAINRDVEWRSEGTVKLGSTSLYDVLKRLLDQGLIELAPTPEAGGERRKVYRLNALGERVFNAEQQRLRRMLNGPARGLVEGKA